MGQVLEYNEGCTRILQLNHMNKHNPFSKDLENSIKDALNKANNDGKVNAVIVTGGEGRSFSSGGDFNEVQNLSGGDEVDEWIDRVIDLYQSVLKVNKPTIAAIDGYAIGMGFQFAMMFDYKLMSKFAKFQMPELKHGIGCSVGVAILETVLTHNAMKEIVVGCESIGPMAAKEYQLIDRVVEGKELIPTALDMAQKLGSYPKTTYQNTKRFMVKKLMNALDSVCEESKKIHRAAFKEKSAHHHFEKVLGKKYKADNKILA